MELPHPITDVESQNPKDKEAKVEESREKWSSPMEFLLSCIAMSVGLGNFYRFPYVAYTNGGGAFLIPYLVILVFIGRPVYFLELVVGQFSSSGQVKIWDAVPFFRGIGYGTALATFGVITYYSSILAMAAFYFFASFQETLPWTECDANWGGNCSSDANVAELYFKNRVLHEKPEISSGIGNIVWELALCSLFCWIAIFFCIWKGVASSGKAAYFTAIYPYVILLTLLITGARREGAVEGMLYFIRPQWERLLEPKVWYAAVTQCFFSLGTGYGAIIMNASYNSFKHNIYRDAMIVSLVDTFTSLLAGFTVFSILGNLAHESGADITLFAKFERASLIFVAYADAIGKFEFYPQLFSILFYLMLLALGLGSVVSLQMAVITVVTDMFPQRNKLHITMECCAVAFGIGLVYTTEGGQHIHALVDNYTGSYVILILATLEVVSFAWVYGLKKLVLDIEFMLGIKVGWYWKLCWGLVIPLVLPVMYGYTLLSWERTTYADAPLPVAMEVAGCILATTCVGFVPVYALYETFGNEGKEEESIVKKIGKCFMPNAKWGPKEGKTRDEWNAFKKENPQ